MAKRKINKSQAVLAYMADNPDAKPKAVAEALATKGITVTPGAVSTIKFQAAKKGDAPAAKRPGRPAKTGKSAKSAAKSGGNSNLDQLIAAKELADRVGGVDEAKRLLDTLAKLRD